jgi:hypothetical protein
MSLNNLAIPELLIQSTTTNLFLHTLSLNVPVYILSSTNRRSFYLCESAKIEYRGSKFIAHISQNSLDNTSFFISSVLIKTSYSAKLLAQRKVSTAQPSSPRIRHPKLYVYTFMSSSNIYSSTLPSSIQNLRTKAYFHFCLSP